jgi:predicted deacylase
LTHPATCEGRNAALTDAASRPGDGSVPASARFPWWVVPEPAPGEKRSGYFGWPDTVLRELRWPYIAVRGRQQGRAVTVVAAIHGGEYPGILGALRLGRLLDPDRVHGSLLVLPIVNLPAFRERTAFVTPHDGRNLNGVFPGKATGTLSEVLAHRLLHEIVAPADTLIDLHSGDIFETLSPYAGYHAGENDAQDSLARAMTEAFGLPDSVAYPHPANPVGLTGNATRLGIPSIFVEVGGNALASDDDTLTVYQGLINSLRALGVLEGLRPPTTTRWLTHGTTISAPLDGLWRPSITPRQMVAANTTLGTLLDPLGNEIAMISSPAGGVVLYYLSALSARQGDVLAYLASE